MTSDNKQLRVAVIGGGAAGFFAAIHAASNYPKSDVTLLEKSDKLLSKVKISGGGRCNVTNSSSSIKELSSAYPRGGKAMKKALLQFSTPDTVRWFAARGVPLVAESDGRMFPRTNKSQSVIDCLLHECSRLGIKVQRKASVEGLVAENGRVKLRLRGSEEPLVFHKVIIATGGSPKRSGLAWLEDLGHTIEDPVPSLFTFNMPEESVKSLMGVAVTTVTASIPGTKLKSTGPLLITHWGMSGPAVLKLSAFGARILAEKNYTFTVQVNWINVQSNERVYAELEEIARTNSAKLLQNMRPFDLPQRLWIFLLEKVGLNPSRKWGEIGKKGINKLVNILTNDLYSVQGKTTFKEEFVTCGGVSLECINISTMESKICPNVYFAGEVLDIDGITGGFNFQAAWTTGFIAGKLQ